MATSSAFDVDVETGSTTVVVSMTHPVLDAPFRGPAAARGVDHPATDSTPLHRTVSDLDGLIVGDEENPRDWETVSSMSDLVSNRARVGQLSYVGWRTEVEDSVNTGDR